MSSPTPAATKPLTQTSTPTPAPAPAPAPASAPAPAPTPAPQNPPQPANGTTDKPKTNGTSQAKTASHRPAWGAPEGLPIRGPGDENLNVFRQAVGINNAAASTAANTKASTLEQGRREATGIYREVLQEQHRRGLQCLIINALNYACHFLQIVVGALLTGLGPDSGSHATVITVLGAVNTVAAGALALMRGQGLPERMRRDQVEFRKLQDWIEETEALIAAGVIGRDRTEVGRLVEIAFKKYNAAKASEENNMPDSYVPQQPESTFDGQSIPGHESAASDNSMVRLNP